MFSKIGAPLAVAVALSVASVSGNVAYAAGAEAHIDDIDFSFEGPFGKFDTLQLQRGLKVYTEICAACHGLQYVPIRTLHDEGGPHLPEDQVRAYASQFEIFDPELDDYREAKASDHFPGSGLETAPDLSLMAKKRAGFHGPYGTGINQLVKGIGGPEYIYTLLTAYEDPPECAPEDFPGSYNTAFAVGGYPDECKDEAGHHTTPGSWISMGQPLWGDDVEFDDGHPADMHNEAKDVAAFLMWTAEPKLMARKYAGLTGVLFLTLLSVLLYLTNKRLWAPIKGKKRKH
ncbi:cytochrome c1 [Roseovarius sp. M141]|uniref:cytochrome c1 n=1 Tax=Roseovarius sp. M141 TaxID=2583806 RepID=UPI0020CCC3A6|nr:cytochrome c1 [Roseovarius sp. M141]MCQ0091078.1 cytochrome c1 [Roseovarius sp. M141]